jgi:hypothetical protein
MAPKHGVILSSRLSDGGNGDIDIAFDCIVQEAPEFTTTPASSTLEDGADASDHIKIEPPKLVLDIIISSMPIDGESDLDSNEDGIPASIQKIHMDIQEKLLGKIVDVVAGLQTYYSYTVVSYTPSRNAKTANALHFTCAFQKVRFVSTETVIIQLKHHPKGAHPKQALGKQATVTPKAPEAAKLKSLLAQGIDSNGVTRPIQ